MRDHSSCVFQCSAAQPPRNLLRGTWQWMQRAAAIVESDHSEEFDFRRPSSIDFFHASTSVYHQMKAWSCATASAQTFGNQAERCLLKECAQIRNRMRVGNYAKYVLDGLVDTLDKLDMENPCLVRRHGLWEQHGNARSPSVRGSRTDRRRWITWRPR